MSKTLIFIILLIVLLLPTQYLMFTDYKSLDGKIHVHRIQEVRDAILLGHFPVRLAPNLIGEIGYPLFVVNYHLPYYFAQPFILINNNPALAYKLVMSITFMLSGILSFLLFKNLGTNLAALTGAIIFTYLPYRFGDLYMRGAFGESVSIMFIPAILLSIHKINKGNNSAVLLLALSVFGLVTSHTIMVLVFAPLFLLYSHVLLKVKYPIIKKTLIGTSLGILLSSYQIVPAILEKRYIKFDDNLLDLFQGFYINIYQLLRIPAFGVNIGTYLQIGIISSFIILTSIILLLKDRKKYLLFFLTLALLSIFLTNRISYPVWKNIPILSYVLYPYRFLLLTITSTAFLSIYIVDRFKNKLSIALVIIFLTIYTNRHFFTISPWFEIPPSPNLTTQNEADTIWSNVNSFQPRELISTDIASIIKINSKNPYQINASIATAKNTQVTIRKLYFPGWNLTVNGHKKKIDITDGLISFNLPPGSFDLIVKYNQSNVQKTSNLVSLLTFTFLAIIYFKKPKIIYN